MNQRRTTVTMCGWCSGAPLAPSPTKAHKRCHSTDANPCQCAENKHTIKKDTAEVMALYCHIPIEMVYTLHGQKQREPLSEKERAARSERLVKARAVKAAKRKEVTQ